MAPGLPSPGAAEGLSEALAEFVASLGKVRLDERQLMAVLERLGLRGRPPLTLSEAGQRAGLSGERVRQLEARIRTLVGQPDRPPVPPLLEVALATVARAVPVRAADIAQLLTDAGISDGPFSAASLLSAADLCDLRVPFVATGSGPDAVLLSRDATSAVTHLKLIECRARRLVERCGATTTDSLEAELSTQGINVCSLQVKIVLKMCMEVVDCGEGWFSFLDAKSEGAFVRASRRMLAVTSPLPVQSLHGGLRRHNLFRCLPAPPPVAVLTAVYRGHAGFVEEGGMVWSVDPCPETLVGEVNRRMVAILREAPSSVMSRSAFLHTCQEAGLNLTSVNIYTTYSECLERIGRGLVTPIGTVVDTNARRSAERQKGDRRGDGTVAGWTSDGRPWLVAEVTPSTWANGVVHVPADVRPALQGRRFACTDAAGTPVTTLGIDAHGNSWGWTGFLRHVAAKPGSVIRAGFDVDAGTALLELVD